jgi:hypothetical protein
VFESAGRSGKNKAGGLLTLQASPKAVRIADKLNQKRKADLERIARAIEEDFRRQEREQRVSPTPERMRRGDITNKSDRDGARAAVAPDIVHQVKDPLDTVRKYLTEDEIAVIGRFIVNIDHASRTKAITANYEGSSGGGYGPRHGGLPDKSREAASIANWTMQRMHPKWQHLAKLLFYGVQRAKDGAPLTPREIMALFFPAMGDKSRKDGGFIVLYGSLAWRLQELEKELHDAIRGETRRGANHVRQIVREQT